MSLDCSRQAGWETYTLQPGDTWESLASRYRVRQEALKQYNFGFPDVDFELSVEDVTLCVPAAGYHVVFTSEAQAVSTAGWLEWERIQLTDVGPYVTGYNGDEGYYEYRRSDNTSDRLYPGNYSPETRTQEERGYLQPYFIQTEEDLLRWMWVNEWQRTDEFNETEAATLFENQIIEAIALMMQSEVWAYVEESVAGNADELTDQIIQALIDFEGNVEAARSRLQELATQYNLDVNDLITLFIELVELAGANVYRYQVDPQLYEYMTLYYNAQTSAEGETVISYEDFAAFQRDLAVLDYYKQVFGTYDIEQVRRELIDRAVRLEYYKYIRSLPEDELIADSFSLYWARHRENSELNSKTILEIIEHIAGLIEWLQNNATIPNRYLGGGLGYESDYTAEISRSQDALARYYEAVALDSLRKIAYDPQWNLDENLLNQFEAAIEAMPRTIVGVGVGFAQDGFRAHYRTLRRAHEWRIELRGQLNLIEAEMLRRQAEAQQPEPLWWLAEIALSILFEPLDWFFTIRDLLLGNAWALLGFLPLVPHAIGAIVEAGRYLVNVSDEVAALLRQIDANSSIVEAAAEIGIPQSVGGYSDIKYVRETLTNEVVNQSQNLYCVPACTTMLLADQGVDISQDTLAGVMRTTNIRGTDFRIAIDELNPYFVRNGISLEAVGGHATNMDREYAEGLLRAKLGGDQPRPFIINLNAHAIIVDRIELLQEEGLEVVVVRDPWGNGPNLGLGTRGSIRLNELLDVWQSRGFGFLIIRQR